MIKTALDGVTPPPSAKLLGWHLLDADREFHGARQTRDDHR